MRSAASDSNRAELACIGIDASRAISTAPTGTEAYSYHLIRALLAETDAPERVRLYFRSSPASQAAQAALRAAEWRVIPFPRLWTHLRLSWEMMQHPPDLLFVPAHVLPPVRPPRTVVTVHDVGYRYFPEAHPWRQRLYLDASTRWNVRVASRVLADSQATRDAIAREYGTPEDKISVVYPGYDSDLAPVRAPDQLAAARARYAIPGDYVLYLGRIQPRKNLARLVEAFARVLPHHPALTLVLAGPAGWFEADIRARVREVGMEERVLFPGYIAAEDKAALISGARVFAYPSLYEGFGFPVLEAQACEVPLLASAASSVPEVAGEGALLVDPLDTAAIAAGMRRVLEDVALRQSLVARGLANLRRFSWAETARAVWQVFEQVLVSQRSVGE